MARLSCTVTPLLSSPVKRQNKLCIVAARRVACQASSTSYQSAERRTVVAALCSGVVLHSSDRATASETTDPKCFMDISVDGQVLGRVVIQLNDPQSLAAQRFSDLCKGKQGVGYRRSKFDAIFEGKYLRNAGVQALSYGETSSPIAGGDSIAGLYREYDASSAKHEKAGLVSLQVLPTTDIVETTKLVAEKGKLVEVVERSGIVPNGTGFAITTGAAPALDKTNLIVGNVVEGMDVVAQLDKLPVVKNNSGSPFFIVGKAVGDKRANVAELGFDRPFNKLLVASSGLIE